MSFYNARGEKKIVNQGMRKPQTKDFKVCIQ